MDEDQVLKITSSWYDDPDPDHAIQILQDYLQQNPTSLRARLRLAEIFSMEYGEDVPGAERLFRDVLRDDPANIIALTHLGLLQGHPGSTIGADESLQLLTKAAELVVEPWALENLAHKAWDTAHYDLATASFSRLLSLAKSLGLHRLQAQARTAIRDIRRRRPNYMTH